MHRRLDSGAANHRFFGDPWEWSSKPCQIDMESGRGVVCIQDGTSLGSLMESGKGTLSEQALSRSHMSIVALASFHGTYPGSSSVWQILKILYRRRHVKKSGSLNTQA